MAEELQVKEEEKKIPKKGLAVWRLLSYANIIFFVCLMIYIAIDLSREYLSTPEIIIDKKGWTKSTIKLEPFAVNITDRDTVNLLKVTLELEPDEYLLYAEATNKMPQIRDIIITILCQKSIEEMKNSSSKEKLKRDILKYINANLSTGRFKNIFFTEFVIK